MSDEKPKPAPTPSPPGAPGAPPRLERVGAGYRPAPIRPPPAAAPAAPSQSVTPALRPAALRPAPAAAAPRPAAAPGGYGLADRQVTASAAFAASLPLDGALADDSALRLLYLAAATEASGLLSVGSDRAGYGLVLRRGRVEHASSTAVEDELGRFFLRRGVLVPETLVQAEAARVAAGGDLAAAVVAAGLVNPADVAGLLQEHGAGLVLRALAVEAGTWSWQPGVAPPPSAFPLGTPLAMIAGAVRALDVGAVERRLGDRLARAATRVGGRVRPEDLRLTPQETRLLAGFDGRSPAEIAAGQPADAATILRLALLLAETELLAFGAERKAPPPQPVAPSPQPAAAPPPAAAAPAPTPRPAAPRPSPPPVAARPAAPPRPVTPAPVPATTPRPAAPPQPAPSLTLEALQATCAKLASADHFAVLGVKREASAGQVKAAYFQLAKVYHPDAAPAGAAPEVRKLAADVFAVLSEAWAVLGDEARRAEYVRQLESGGAADVDVMSILQAENVFQVGTALVKSRKYDEALQKFDAALKLNPDEPEFAMWKAWCEFLVAPDRKRQHAASASAIEAGLKLNGRCAPGYLFLGQMAKLLGDVALAEKHLKRGLAVAPENADLVRELKYLKK